MSPEEGSARVTCDRPKVKTWRHHRVKVSHSSESIFSMHHLRPSWTGTQVELQVAVCWSLLWGITPHWVVSSISIKCIVKLWQFVIVNESSPHRSKIPIRPSAPHTRHSPSFASVLLVVVNNKSIFFDNFPFHYPFFPFFRSPKISWSLISILIILLVTSSWWDGKKERLFLSFSCNWFWFTCIYRVKFEWF